MKDENEVILVPRCKVCNKLYKKSEENEYGLCPKCLAEKQSTNDNNNSQPVVEVVKPGQAIRERFVKLIEDKKINDEIILILTSTEQTKSILKIRYAFLIEYDSTKDIKEQSYIKGHARYYSKPIEINDKQYLITNDLYKRNVENFMQWADSLSK